MRPSDQLAEFTRKAISAGKSREDIRDALSQAGWAPNEVAGALDAWADIDFPTPVPRPRPYVSAKEAFFYGIMFAALAMTAWHLVDLAHRLINHWVDDPLSDYTSRYDLEWARWSIAALIVFAPTFLMMNRAAAKSAKLDPGKRRSGVRKWFIYVTLFFSALALLGDLTATIYALLNGDLTLRFALKALSVAVVAGTIFIYFRSEIREVDDAA
ncbi:hypothetical protein SAMN04488030_2383 [Aliiroseovarius halocynthiae]|uniref:DUF5671 domain-containing protein n=1 Tax=Aliiroseovarius halocynthiae TaxID=985055 RepID=A0A545SZD9_9RHOB|nr:DUF5671 domain-containing protein [Aliiroseovarius halocynthiae]TQV70334.1 hypothetical protein FIL88_00035 [Aliiroseovarius halocynthiae]SMR81993.1 hypothetical protein SAMN04488030_2383 [Aliiroseovarius halocynthiae]